MNSNHLLYINNESYPHLKQECLVMLNSFYAEGHWKLTETRDKARFFMLFEKGEICVYEENQEQTRAEIIEEDYRNEVKRILYNYLSQMLGKTLPWGILQGIRPTKLVFKLYRQLLSVKWLQTQAMIQSKPDIVKMLMEQYYVSRPMAELCIDVAIKESEFLPATKDEAERWASIYISIPFCPSRCHYCSFPSNPMMNWERTSSAYVDCLIEEMKCIVPLILKKKKISTIYIGGGTPTTLVEKDLNRLLVYVKDNIVSEDVKEWTVEAGRPDTINREKLSIIKKNGVQRISINPQSMNQDTLDLIGRKHDTKAIKETFNLAREIGFEQINMDLIMGLPGETIEHVKSTLNQVMMLEPSDVTIHTLAIKRSSVINENPVKYPLPTDEETREMLAYTRKMLTEKMGYKPYYLYRQKNMVGSYENVGYSKLEIPCIYNMEIMEEALDIYAFGVGGVTKLIDKNGNLTRVENLKNAEQYMNRINEMISRKKDAMDQ